MCARPCAIYVRATRPYPPDRSPEVTKFVGFSKIWSEDDARALAEPEDQVGSGTGRGKIAGNLMQFGISGTGCFREAVWEMIC